MRPAGIATISLVLLTVAAGAFWMGLFDRRPHHPRERFTLVDVRRADLFPKLRTGGEVASSKRTVIECELERLTIGVKGQGMSAGGASVLLSIVPEGTVVSEGDVLAVLDSSDYEELVRQQTMTVERSRADYEQARLTHEIAKLAVIEFQDGTMREALKQMEGQIALVREDLQRSADRLRWSERMKEKGYVSASQVASDKYSHSRALFDIARQESGFSLYQKYTAPKNLKVLEGQVKAAEATMIYQRRRLLRNEERLRKLQTQVEHCTIRAPHDGFVIYANDRDRDLRIEPGMSVRQRQDLMYLPDLTKMEVVAMLHESTIRSVEPGMRAHVELEGIPGRQIEGHVTSIAQLPTFNWRSDVRYFPGIVRLENVPQGIKPGMTAEVEIDLARRDDVLTLPPQAVVSEGGHDVCYVATEEGVERREVVLGETTSDLLEIASGLDEGESVVFDPPRNDPDFIASALPSSRPHHPTTELAEWSTEPTSTVHSESPAEGVAALQ
jgi:HlyD family secretion protein